MLADAFDPCLMTVPPGLDAPKYEERASELCLDSDGAKDSAPGAFTLLRTLPLSLPLPPWMLWLSGIDVSAASNPAASGHDRLRSKGSSALVEGLIGPPKPPGFRNGLPGRVLLGGGGRDCSRLVFGRDLDASAS
jgi:hypothetical protein